jgi:hypothetical protein
MIGHIPANANPIPIRPIRRLEKKDIEDLARL